ncbi:MAG: hypothetical protein AMXMBFR46_03950 [Acidimicrobiia bacterium]
METGTARRPVGPDGRFAPAHAPGVAALDVAGDGGAGRGGGRTGARHVGNPPAARRWHSVDGGATIDEICTDVAEAVGAPFAQVRDDTLAVVAQLEGLGLLSTGEEALGGDVDLGTLDLGTLDALDPLDVPDRLHDHDPDERVPGSAFSGDPAASGKPTLVEPPSP